jgi:hypothetical protein
MTDPRLWCLEQPAAAQDCSAGRGGTLWRSCFPACAIDAWRCSGISSRRDRTTGLQLRRRWHALAYGTGVCGKVAQGRGYAEVIGEVKPDLHAADEFQASYLISQAVNELCAAWIWQLPNSATHYRPPAP